VQAAKSAATIAAQKKQREECKMKAALLLARLCEGMGNIWLVAADTGFDALPVNFQERWDYKKIPLTMERRDISLGSARQPVFARRNSNEAARN
jgi:hypothetical protein